MESLRAQDPTRVGTYRLLGRLGEGGMGEVFLGESPGHRKVAVKRIKPEHAADPDFRRRFAREVAAVQRVGGFYTAPVVDADPDGNPPWLVTDYIDGQTLSDAVKRDGPFDSDQARRLGAALAEGLAAIHACGLIHRDFKPGNIMLASDGTPRIMDFGLARMVDASTLTSAGAILGTYQFMSPEQIAGQRVDARSDVFALGGVLAYAATGHGPFGGHTVAELQARICAGPPDLDGVTGPLREAIDACLEKDPVIRPTLDEVTEHLADPGTFVTPVQSQEHFLPERIDRSATAPVVSPSPVTLRATPPAVPPAVPLQRRPRRKRGIAIAASAGALAVAASAGVVIALQAGGSAPASATAGSVPSGYLGTWTGTLHDSASHKMSPTITITGGKKGSTVGQVFVPGNGCRYALSLISASTSEVIVQENVQGAPGAACFSKWVALSQAAPGLTGSVYNMPPSTGSVPTFTGHLTR